MRNPRGEDSSIHKTFRFVFGWFFIERKTNKTDELVFASNENKMKFKLRHRFSVTKTENTLIQVDGSKWNEEKDLSAVRLDKISRRKINQLRCSSKPRPFEPHSKSARRFSFDFLRWFDLESQRTEFRWRRSTFRGHFENSAVESERKEKKCSSILTLTENDETLVKSRVISQETNAKLTVMLGMTKCWPLTTSFIRFCRTTACSVKCLRTWALSRVRSWSSPSWTKRWKRNICFSRFFPRSNRFFYLSFVDLISFAFTVQSRSEIATTRLNSSTEMMRQSDFQTSISVKTSRRRKFFDRQKKSKFSFLTFYSTREIFPWRWEHFHSRRKIEESNPNCSWNRNENLFQTKSKTNVEDFLRRSNWFEDDFLHNNWEWCIVLDKVISRHY